MVTVRIEDDTPRLERIDDEPVPLAVEWVTAGRCTKAALHQNVHLRGIGWAMAQG